MDDRRAAGNGSLEKKSRTSGVELRLQSVFPLFTLCWSQQPGKPGTIITPEVLLHGAHTTDGATLITAAADRTDQTIVSFLLLRGGRRLQRSCDMKKMNPPTRCCSTRNAGNGNWCQLPRRMHRAPSRSIVAGIMMTANCGLHEIAIGFSFAQW